MIHNFSSNKLHSIQPPNSQHTQELESTHLDREQLKAHSDHRALLLSDQAEAEFGPWVLGNDGRGAVYNDEFQKLRGLCWHFQAGFSKLQFKRHFVVTFLTPIVSRAGGWRKIERSVQAWVFHWFRHSCHTMFGLIMLDIIYIIFIYQFNTRHQRRKFAISRRRRAIRGWSNAAFWGTWSISPRAVDLPPFFCFTINKLQSWRVFTLFASLKLSSYILHQWILSVLQFSFFACLVLLQSFGKCWMHLAPGRSTLTCLSGAGEQPSNGCQWRWGVLADSGISVPLLRGMKSDSRERGDSIICLNTTSTNLIAQPFPQW